MRVGSVVYISINDLTKYAYPDISFEFASWLSPKFKLYLIKEFERLIKLK